MRSVVDHARRQQRAVVERRHEVRAVEEQQLEILERRGQVKPERDPAHPVEVGLLLEGGDGHPQDGEQAHDDEGEQAGVDEHVPPDLPPRAPLLLARQEDGDCPLS